MKTTRVLAGLAIGIALGARGPAAGFDVDAYRRFLQTHADLEAADLEAMYPPGRFARYAPTEFAAAAFSDSVDRHLRLTWQEKDLIRRHGFAVTERLSPPSFGAAFLEIYRHDLPVFVSTDAILHALHMSYDAILAELEATWISPRLADALGRLHARLAARVRQHPPEARLAAVYADVDLYLTVPQRLLALPVEPIYPANAAPVAHLLECVAQQAAATVWLFGADRQVDFSQFVPRGHYTQWDLLERYFRAMMWLGRIELYLRSPGGSGDVSEAVVRHQTAMAGLVAELAAESGADAALEGIEGLLRALVGEQDNATLAQLRQALGTRDAASLLEPEGLAAFQAALAELGGGEQRILSQILMVDPMAPEPVAPAAAFLLLGQRFVVDSYIAGNVVFDRIRYQGQRPFRGLPASLDVLFALGNDAALPLLAPQLEQFHYATNLAGLRYLVDSFDAAFWRSSFHHGWLRAIRTLQPPAARHELPAFMQTAAWWQEKLTTQLASWAQLRHDHLLYAKQSYTAGVICSYPAGYVEPIPAFYTAVRELALDTAPRLEDLLAPAAEAEGRYGRYFRTLAAIADTLATIAGKELAGAGFSAAEKEFLANVMFDVHGDCVTYYGGWYPRLFFTEDGFLATDMVVADVHTQPTDSFGAPVGYVLHVGTGPVNTAVVVAAAPGGPPTAFVGPVLSYYEHVSTNYHRLTDEEWQSAYASPPSFRPDFVRLYLADARGGALGPGSELPTAVADGQEDWSAAAAAAPAAPALVLGQAWPNPFNASVLFRFSIGPTAAGERVRLTVHNAAGQAVARLLDQVLPAGHYTARWDGTDADGAPAASGVYAYVLTAGRRQASGRVSLVR